MKHLVTILSLILTLSACSTVAETGKPMKWAFNQKPQGGTPEYNRGWDEGCESGLASMTNDYYKMFYKFRQDVTLVSNPEYFKPWTNAFNFCRHFAYGQVREGNARMKLPNDDSVWKSGTLPNPFSVFSFNGLPGEKADWDGLGFPGNPFEQPDPLKQLFHK